MHYKESEVRHAGNLGLLAAINISWHSFDTWHWKLDELPYYAAAILLYLLRRLKGLRKIWSIYGKAVIIGGVARVRELWL